MGVNVEKTGKLIYNLAIKKFGSVKNISSYLGISRTAIYHWKYGQKIPSIDNIVLLSEYIGLPIESMIVREQ